MAGVNEPSGGIGVALERDGGSEGGDLDVEAIEESQEPEYAGAAAVFVDGLRRKVPVSGLYRAGNLPKAFVATITGVDGTLGAFFHVDHHVERHAGATGPCSLRRLRSVPHVVAGPVLGNHSGLLSAFKCSTT